MSAVKAIRKARGVTQRLLADEAAIGESTIGALEAGRLKPRPGTLIALLQGANCIAPVTPEEIAAVNAEFSTTITAADVEGEQ